MSSDIEKRLDDLAKATGRTKTYYVREAILEHLDDMEEAYLAEATLERVRRGDERVLSSEEFWRGMED
ncbi:type II toxin-antitoxin system RelB family antitoxin [Acidithiobacillus thiooxidans]|uniref:type II toxin-antitoxin system RelB family antitoxin n=1 Tax=Acidithiobacillus thiooxidans TaxID=930 RepID=UPI0021F8E9F5|nr:TraY domain-containing protein [Acidithiobacillus thiooxidans]